MKRDFQKLIAEGDKFIKKHERMDMTIDEIRTLLDATEPGNLYFTLWDAYRAGVAAGVRITKADNARRAEK